MTNAIFSEGRLAKRLLVSIILFSAFITIFTTAVQLYFDYRVDVDQIHSEIQQIETAHLSPLSESIWGFDQAQTQSQLDGLVQLPGIEHLVVVVENEKRWEAGLPSSSNVIAAEFPLVHSHKGIPRLLGTLKVAASLDDIYQRLLQKAGLILLTNAIKTFIVAGFILVIVHRLVTRHLRTLAVHARGLQPGQETAPLKLQRPKKTEAKHDELDALVSAVNDMKDRLAKSYDELRDGAQKLEQRVDERTRELTAEIAERKRLEKELVETEKVRAVNRVTGGIAHHFNNFLCGQLTLLEVAKETADDPAIRDLVEKASKNGWEAAALVKKLMLHSQRHILKPAPFDANDLVLEMADTLRELRDPRISIETNLADPLPTVFADRSAIDDILMALTDNARAAMADGGCLKIATASVDLRKEKEDGELPAARYVEISVSDDGSGMPPEVIERALEPFFTTADVGEGAGLGLSMAYGIVAQSGGRLAIESAVGKGTEVKILLPMAA